MFKTCYMEKSIFSKSKLLSLITTCIVIFLLSSSLVSGQTFKLFAVSDLKQIFEDGFNLPEARDTMNIFGIRGEIISGQLAVNVKNNLTNVTVEIGVLKNQLSGNSLPGNNIEWNFVGSIPLTKNTPNQPVTAVTRQAPAKFPDYLMAEREINISKGTYQAIWLTIKIPSNADAGNYSGYVTVKSAQGELSLPVSLTIYPLILPAERHLKVTEWYSTRNFSKVYGIQEEYSDAWFAMLKTYAANMVDHRQNIFQVPMNSIEIRNFKSGGLEFDFRRFDQIAQVFWNTGKMNYLETGELAKFGEKGWGGTDIVLKDFSVKNSETGEKITMPGKEVIPFLLPAFESHLRQKGWLHKTLFHVKDEPTLGNALSWREMSRYIHNYAPDLARIDAIELVICLAI